MNEGYTLTVDATTGEVALAGSFRLAGAEAAKRAQVELEAAASRVGNGLLELDLRRLTQVNAEGLWALAGMVRSAAERKVQVNVTTSSILPSNAKVLPLLSAVASGVTFDIYDQDLYGSQKLMEAPDLVPLLNAQTKVLWPLERGVLQRHGLKPGMRIADICCGCGDGTLLIVQEYQPSLLVGVDHAEQSVNVARKSAEALGLEAVEFERGEATALLQRDNSFDFVMCRLGMQIFGDAEQILKELVRITKPGGRVYLTGEDYDLIVGHPNEEVIHETYAAAGQYGADLGMDLYNGRKLSALMEAGGLEGIQHEAMVVDTYNSAREDFAAMIEQWRKFSAYTIAEQLQLPEADQQKLLAGYDAHLKTIREPGGYTNWTVFACSGRKPEQ